MGKTLLSLWGLKPPDLPDLARKTASDVDVSVSESDACSKTSNDDSQILTLQTPSDKFCDSASGPGTPSFFARKTQQSNEELPQKLSVSELAPKAPAPVVMCTLRASPEKLRALKPRVHGFFVKKTAAPPSQLASELKSIVMPTQPACWPKHHVRASRSAPTATLPRRKRLPPRPSKPKAGPSGPASIYGRPLPFLEPPKPKEIPERQLLTSEEARSIASERLPANDPLFARLIERAGMPTPFDLGSWETQMWYQKYAPQQVSECLNAEASQRVHRWLKRQMKALKSGPIVPRRRTELDDFIDDGRSGGQVSYLLLHGPSGMGKTAAVYAAAGDLGAFVFEVNASQKRGGKELVSLLDGIGHSRAVHSGADGAKNAEARPCIILIEDVDVLYETETNFFATLDRIASTTRRPIVLTCQDLDRLPFSLLDAAKQIYVGPLSPANILPLFQYVRLVAFCEGHLLNKDLVWSVVFWNKGDIRKTLTYLQFWCQMGLGGRPSASDWLLKEPGFDRVISVGTPIKLPESGPRLEDLWSNRLSTAETAEMLSYLDGHRRPTTICEPPQDALQGIAAPEYIEVTELPISDYLADPYHAITSQALLRRLRDEIWCAGRSNLLATDYAPYTLIMAKADVVRASALDDLGATRHSRRSWAALGVDGRRHVPNADQILRIGGPTIPSFLK